jgi:hypothetical protein
MPAKPTCCPISNAFSMLMVELAATEIPSRVKSKKGRPKCLPESKQQQY